jgi:outer membrane immunogenic protein
LVGIEADIGLTDRESDTRPVPATDFTQIGVCHPNNRPVGSAKADWDASLRAQLGFLVNPNTLPYGSAGVAWQKTTVNASCSASPGDGCVLAHDESASKVLSGWTAGLGLEYRFSGDWLARADYRFSSL